MTDTSPSDQATREAGRRRRTLAAVGGAALIAVVVGTWVGGTGSSDAGVIAGVLPAPLLPGLRMVVDGAGIATVGVALLLILLAGTEDVEHRVAARATRLGVAAGAVWCAAALLAIWLQAADAAGIDPFRVRASTVVGYAGSIDAARGLLLSAAAGAVFVGLALGRRSALERWPEAAGLVAVAGLLAGPVTGHAGTHDDGGLSLVLIVVHVAASAAWVGGLGAMLAVLARRRDVLAAVLPRFSALAGACIVAVTISGAATALVQIPAPADLLATGYGRLVLVKVACLAGLGLLGWRARRELRHRAAVTTVRGAGMSMSRLLVLEVTLMAVTIGAAAALASTSASV